MPSAGGFGSLVYGLSEFGVVENPLIPAVTLGVGLVTRNTLAAIIGGGVTLGLGHWLIG